MRAKRIATYQAKKAKLNERPHSQKIRQTLFSHVIVKSNPETEIRKMEEGTELPIFLPYYEATVIKGVDGAEDLILPDIRYFYYLADLDALAHPSFNCTWNELYLPSNVIDLSNVPALKSMTKDQVATEIRALVERLLNERNPETWEELGKQIKKHYYI